MKRAKKLYTLLGVLLAVCVVTFGVSKYEEHKEVIKNSDEIILELDSEKVQSLSWKNEEEELAFHKGETWIYDKDEAFPVDEEKIKELLSQFSEFGVSFIIEEVEDYGQYGLADPICSIQIGTEEKEYEILLGDYSAMDSQRYVSIGDGNVYLVKEDPLDHFDAVLTDMIDNDEIPDMDKVTGLTFNGTENYQVTYEEESDKTYCEEDVYFTEVDGKPLPLDTERVDSYLETIKLLNFTEYVTYQAGEEDLKPYGLDKPELTVTIPYTSVDEEEKESEGTFVLNIGRDPKEKAKAEKEEAKQKSEEEISEEETEEEEITAYARVGESDIIYKLTSEDYRNLMDASYNTLRHQEVLSADFADINQIDITLEGKNYTLTSKGKEEKRKYYYQEEEIDIVDLRSSFDSLTADSFTDEKPTEKEEINLTVHLDNENFPTVQISLYRYDGTNCLAAVDGKSVSLVDRAAAVDLIEAVNAIVLN